MHLKTKILKLSTGRPIAIVHNFTAAKINVHVGERIRISRAGKSVVAVIDTTKGDFLKRDEIAVSNDIIEELSLKEDEAVEVSLCERPITTFLIRKKMEGQELSEEEIKLIIKSIVENSLTEPEIAFFVASVFKIGMTEKETKYLIEAMVSTGEKLSFSGKVVDKHSIGGIAGNRTTPIVVSICAAAGLTMPKTSSRAITSAAGTADVIESIADVEFSVQDMKKIVKKTNACMVWNGILGLSPADDKLIQIERLLNLDPEPQLLASVLSKKISVGSKYVLIDIPYGKYAKVDKSRAFKLKNKFEKFGKMFGLKLRAVLTKGEQPIGHGIGPYLEIRDVIRVLKRENAPIDLEKKGIFLAGQIFELCSMVEKGKGEVLANDILETGRAYQKFKEIIEAQNGKVPTIAEIEKKLGKFTKDILSTKDSIIKEIDNKGINKIASIAGSPMDKGSGIYLFKHIGEKVEKGEKILTIYSESEARLNEAIELYNKLETIRFY